MNDEPKIIDKGLKIFAKIIAQQMVSDGINLKSRLINEETGEREKCEIHEQKLVA